LLGIVFAVWTIKQRTNQRSKAAPSTTLLFDPATQNVTVGDTFSSDITVNPGSNFVSTLMMVISYDSSKVTISPSDIKQNNAVFTQVLEGPTQPQCNQSICSFSYSLGTGSDPTNIITKKTKVATVTFKAIGPTGNTPATVSFTGATKVYSTASTDTSRENVLSTTAPLTIQIGSGAPTPPVCQANISLCQWDQMDNTTTYHVKIEDTTNNTVVIEQDVVDPNTSLSFPSQGGVTYKCTVTGKNSCGQSQPGIGTQSCPLPSPSPTSCPAPQGVTNLQIICPNCTGATN